MKRRVVVPASFPESSSSRVVFTESVARFCRPPTVRSASLLAWVKSAIAFREMAFRARSTFEKNREIREHSSPRTRVGASALWKAHRSSFTCAMSDGTLTERERLVYSAKLAEQAERYDGAFGVPLLFGGDFSREQRAIDGTDDGDRGARSADPDATDETAGVRYIVSNPRARRRARHRVEGGVVQALTPVYERGEASARARCYILLFFPMPHRRAPPNDAFRVSDSGRPGNAPSSYEGDCKLEAVELSVLPPLRRRDGRVHEGPVQAGRGRRVRAVRHAIARAESPETKRHSAISTVRDVPKRARDVPLAAA